MGALDVIASGLEGVSQGFGQGMDLYDRFQNIQDKTEARNKRKSIENAVIKMHEDGTVDKDPIAFSNNVANLFLEHGDTEGYSKWSNAAASARNLKAQRSALNAFAKAQLNPEAAIADLNDMYKTYGNNNSITSQRTPNGLRVTMNIDGNVTTTDYDPSNMDRFHHDVLGLAEAYAMPPEDFAKVQIERSKAESAERDRIADNARQDKLLPLQMQAYGAQARASDASAMASSERAATERQGRRSTLDALAADARYKQWQAEHPNEPRPETPMTGEAVLSSVVPKVDELSDETPGLTSDKAFIGGIMNDLRNNGMKDSDAAYTATEIAALPMDQIRGINAAEGRRTGSIQINGRTIPYTPTIEAALVRVGKAAADAGVK